MLERSFEILLRLRARDVFPGAWELIAQQLFLPSGPAGPRAGESGWLYERIYRAGAPLGRRRTIVFSFPTISVWPAFDPPAYRATISAASV